MLEQLEQDLSWKLMLLQLERKDQTEYEQRKDTKFRLQREKRSGPGLFARRLERLIQQVDNLNNDVQQRYRPKIANG